MIAIARDKLEKPAFSMRNLDRNEPDAIDRRTSPVLERQRDGIPAFGHQ